jgi:hypothetical protein
MRRNLPAVRSASDRNVDEYAVQTLVNEVALLTVKTHPGTV